MKDINDEQHTSIENLLMEMNAKQDLLLEENKRLKEKMGFMSKKIAFISESLPILLENQKFTAVISKQHNITLSSIEIRQNLVIDYYIDPAKARPAIGKMKTLQQNCLEVFKEFARICKKCDIDYWLDGGGLLGVVRHDGKCIPWDYDIDIAIMEDEYKKFLSILDENLDPKFALRTHDFITRIGFTEGNGGFIEFFPHKQLEDSVLFEQNRMLEEISHKNETIFPTKYAEFEGMQIKIPNNPDAYLRKMFGPYERFPKAQFIHPNYVEIEDSRF